MCGILGGISIQLSASDQEQRITKALDCLAHRGPDGDGIFVDADDGVVLGHRRLAIIDPEHGKQPMSTADGAATVVFNGAIYNYLELRRELIAKGHPLCSYSDTEVLLYAYREWGENCVERFQGMFAFAIWDPSRRRLFCARDRVGIKPFYYFFNGVTLVFASEIKAILATGLVKAESSQAGLQDYLTLQFCLNDKTLFKNINKLEPGYCMVAQLDGSNISLKLHQYWEVNYEIDDTHDEAWFVDHLAGLIEDATRMHLRSDVPLGAHLSGGLDSSSIVCLAASLLKGERLKTFTGAFPEGSQFDETGYAKTVATFADTDYQEIYVQGGTELSQVLPKLLYYMDEPSAGPGLIPQFYVAKLAARHVKVVLGGQGGDELFIGYVRYLMAYLEKCLSSAIDGNAHQSKFAVTLDTIIPTLPLLKTYKSMLQEFWNDGLFDPPDRRYFKLVDRSGSMSRVISPAMFEGSYSTFESFQRIFNRPGLGSMINQMTYFDLKGSLPALLHVEDRTSMAASIESRLPLLDHRIIEHMARIPPNIKFARGRMKYLFKEAMRNTVPAETLERKDKMGFPTPLVHWARGQAREFMRDILLSDRVRQRGIYNFAAIEGTIASEHEFGRVIWGLLCLELWHRIYIDGDMRPHA